MANEVPNPGAAWRYFKWLKSRDSASCSGTFDNAKPVSSHHPMNKFTRPTALCCQVA